MNTNKRFRDEISETLIIPLYMRAVENRRKDAILQDKTAEAIFNKLNHPFERIRSIEKAYRTAQCCIIRAKYFDEKIVEFTKRDYACCG
ncbi:MAG: hypothetical protein J6Y79_04410 [Paludibacteraceae bacterium]|nr:hypothetical protein [Paludibacteraceae bacterium]